MFIVLLICVLGNRISYSADFVDFLLYHYLLHAHMFQIGLEFYNSGKNEQFELFYEDKKLVLLRPQVWNDIQVLALENQVDVIHVQMYTRLAKKHLNLLNQVSKKFCRNPRSSRAFLRRLQYSDLFGTEIFRMIRCFKLHTGITQSDIINLLLNLKKVNWVIPYSALSHIQKVLNIIELYSPENLLDQTKKTRKYIMNFLSIISSIKRGSRLFSSNLEQSEQQFEFKFLSESMQNNLNLLEIYSFRELNFLVLNHMFYYFQHDKTGLRQFFDCLLEIHTLLWYNGQERPEIDNENHYYFENISLNEKLRYYTRLLEDLKQKVLPRMEAIDQVIQKFGNLNLKFNVAIQKIQGNMVSTYSLSLLE